VTWVAWHQHRVEVALVAAAAAVLAALLTAQGLAQAAAHPQPAGWAAGLTQFETLGLVMVPAVLGMWLGAPLLARELERGTHRLAWAQSVSRRRWLLVKLALVLGAVVAAMAAAGWLMYLSLRPWLQAPPDGLPNVFSTGTFDAVGVVPLAYAAFALALGVCLGMLLRRTLIAMFLVLVLFVALRVPIVAFVRPHYEPPLRQMIAVAAVPNGGRVRMPA